jgi:hypothetical protein
MKNRTIFTGALAALALTATSSGAFASTVDLHTVDMNSGGTIHPFSSTDLGGSPKQYSLSTTISGVLTSGTEVIFTFTLPGLIFNSAISDASYSYQDHSHVTHTGAADANGATAPVVWTATPYTFIASDIKTGKIKVTIDNTTGSNMDFTEIFSGIVTGYKSSKDFVTYETSCIDAPQVPLPAALPLFGGALAGLFGFGRARKKQMAAA